MWPVAVADVELGSRPRVEAAQAVALFAHSARMAARAATARRCDKAGSGERCGERHGRVKRVRAFVDGRVAASGSAACGARRASRHAERVRGGVRVGAWRRPGVSARELGKEQGPACAGR